MAEMMMIPLLLLLMVVVVVAATTLLMILEPSEGLLCARCHVSLHNNSVRKVNYTHFTDLEPESLRG